MIEEKFVGDLRLVEACRAPGCPVCRCVADDSRRRLDALLYEQVTDLETRRAIRASWGFCNRHTWMLLDLASALFGAAIIYEDLVTRALRQTRGLGGSPGRRGWLGAVLGRWRRPSVAGWYRRRAACPVCAGVIDTETRYLRAMLRLEDDGDLQAAYAGSDGLCLPHLLAAAEGESEGSGIRTLVERTRAKWERVGQDLASFVGKHDYRNREPFTAAEIASYTRAFELLVGAKGVQAP